MLSFFPELLFLAPFAAFFIRIALSVVFAMSAFERVRKTQPILKVFGVIDALIAIALFLGMYTQLAALVGVLCSLVWLSRPEWNPYPRSTAALVFVMSLSLLVLGAGPFAFDLPL